MDLPGIDDVTFFDQIARSRTLTDAAREWGVSPSAVSKRLTQLETRLQVRLVQRSTRRLTLTDEGTRYAEGVSRLLPQLTDLEESISAQHREPRGRITIHCTIGLGRAHIAPMLREFVNQHLRVQVDLELSHLPLNIAGTSFDCAIWVGKLQDSRLKVKLLHPSRRVVCAAPDYLRARGAPADLLDLDKHACIVIRQGDSDFALWRFGNDEDEESSVRVKGDMISNDGDVATQWCMDGQGLLMRSLWHVGPMLADGRLVQVLSNIPTPPANIHIVYPSGSHPPRRVTLLIEHLRTGLRERMSNIDW